ncbi:MAG: RNA helicase domain-containing protein [Oscillospiraceae bacterium]|nr:RNA helicase domain-containing protein [Oscillospiraceae bacterium]
MTPQDKARSWFTTLNNPADCFPGISEPADIAEQALALWCDGHPTRTGAVAYCESAKGMKHLHMVLEDSSMARFAALKKAYPTAHIEPTIGSKAQAEDYIQKNGKFAEKGETVLHIARRGEIQGRQGQRTDLEAIPMYIEQGLTPEQIMDISFKFCRYEREIRSAYYRKRYKETPPYREVFVRWHYGEPGAGKTQTYVKLCERHQRENIYFVNNYKNGFDKYNGQPILFLDDLKGESQMTFGNLLSILDGYTGQVACRYVNVIALWTTVEITSVFPPDEIYDAFLIGHRERDSFEQLKRRINVLIHHYKDKDGKLCEREIQMADY